MQAISNRRHVRKSAAGFTLLEIVTSLSILSIVTIGSLYATGNLVKLNRLSMMELAASSAINAEMSRAASIAGNRVNQRYAGGTARAFVYYLKNYSDYLKSENDGNRYRFVRIGMKDGLSSSGVLIYEFPVPTPGFSKWDVDKQEQMVRVEDIPLSEASGGSLYGVGIMEVYLAESAVPDVFHRWNNITVDDGVVSTYPRTFFDMDNNDADGGEFMRLFSPGNASDYADGNTNLKNLPIRLNVRYYNSFAQLEADRSPAGIGFSGDNAAISIQRDFLITDDYTGSTALLESLEDTADAPGGGVPGPNPY